MAWIFPVPGLACLVLVARLKIKLQVVFRVLKPTKGTATPLTAKRMQHVTRGCYTTMSLLNLCFISSPSQPYKDIPFLPRLEGNLPVFFWGVSPIPHTSQVSHAKNSCFNQNCHALWLRHGELISGISQAACLPLWRRCWVVVCWWRSPLRSLSSPYLSASLGVLSMRNNQERETTIRHVNIGLFVQKKMCFFFHSIAGSHFLSSTLIFCGID